MKPRNMMAHLIATLGVLIVLTELVRHWLQGHEMEGGVILVGAGFGFVGAYMADRKGALEGGGFVVDSVVKIGGIVTRLGRRSTDNVVVRDSAGVIVTTPEPSAAPANPVQWKDGSDAGVL